MSNLTDLVPPLELCQKIPPGEFQDSALAHISREGEWGHAIMTPVRWKVYKKCGWFEIYPAPTLQEIMVEIDNLGGWCPTAYRLQNQWTVDYQEDKEDGMNDIVEQTDPDNPATAALKLWLKLKGIEE